MHTLMISTIMDVFAKTNCLFSRKKSSNLFACHALANMSLTSKKPISQLIHYLGEENKDWTHHYRLYSQNKWNDEKIFVPIIQSLASELNQNQFLAINYDETSIPKGGKKVPGVALLRDPHSPKFRANFKLALRCGQASIQLPITFAHTIARSVPIDFKVCPVLKKPSRKASEWEINEFKKKSKEQTFSKQALERFKSIRRLLDDEGFYAKTILMVVDNAFCNATIFKSKLERISVLARARKDSKLCFAAEKPKGTRFFDSRTFSPEEILKDSKIQWKCCQIFKKGRQIEISYKEVKNVYWRTSAGRKPLNLLVIAPLRYWKHKEWQYTDPAFLLTDNLEISARELIQAYNNRWQIEVNHWDEKDVFGLGDAQVWSEKSVERQLRSVIYAYSVLLIAGRQYEVGRQAMFLNGMSPSKWYSKRPRWSLRDMISRLRYELWSYPECINNMGLKLDMVKSLIFNAC